VSELQTMDLGFIFIFLCFYLFFLYFIFEILFYFILDLDKSTTVTQPYNIEKDVKSTRINDIIQYSNNMLVL